MAEPLPSPEPPEPPGPSQPLRVVIEFEPGAEVAGSVAGTGPPTPFQGRLELYTAIERAREGA